MELQPKSRPCSHKTFNWFLYDLSPNLSIDPETLTSCFRLPKSWWPSLSSSVHPSTPDSLTLRQDNHNLGKRFPANLSGPINPRWKLYTGKHHPSRQPLRGCFMSKAPWGRRLAWLKSSVSLSYIIFHDLNFPSVFGNSASDYNVKVVV